MQFHFLQVTFIPTKRTIFNYDSKLELPAAVLAVRLKCTILEELDFDIHEKFWTNTKITLCCTRSSSKRFLIYIINC